jgi:hypothetical protein
MEFAINFTLSRDELLHSGFNWKKLRSEIETQDQDFSVSSLLEEYMQILRTLCLTAFDIHGVAIANCTRYFSILQNISGVPEGAIPAIFVYPTDDTSAPPMKHEQVPLQQLNYILTRWDILINAVCPPSDRAPLEVDDVEPEIRI